MQVLSYFKPLHKAVVYHCNLCGRETGKDEYQTAKARRLEAAELEGHYVFCLECSPHIEEIVRKVSAYEAQLAADHEKARNGQLQELARQLLADLTGASGVTPPPRAKADAPPAPAQRRRSPMQIPNPNE